MNIKNTLMHVNFLRKKPRVAIKVFNGYLRGFILKRSVLRTVDFAVTNACNSRCRMCSAWLLYRRSDSKGKKVLSPDQIIDVFLQASRLGAMHINLTGGEPFMRPIDELCYIIKNVRPKFHLISLVTNSLAVTKEKLEKLKEAGLDTLQLSIESMDAKTHDEIRGVPGNFKKVMQVYKWAKELHFIICLSAVITHQNFDEINRIIKFARKNNKNDTFVLLNPISASGAVLGQTQMKLTQEDLEKYNKLLDIGFVRSDMIINFSGKRGCPGGKERIHITAFGDVITCPHVQISYGNVLREPLKDIWAKMRDFPYLKEYSPVCKHSFKQEFYDKFLHPIENVKDVPVPINDHPALKDEYKRYLKKKRN